MNIDEVDRQVNTSVLGLGLELLEDNVEVAVAIAGDTSIGTNSEEEKICKLVSEIGRVCEKRSWETMWDE